MWQWEWQTDKDTKLAPALHFDNDESWRSNPDWLISFRRVIVTRTNWSDYLYCCCHRPPPLSALISVEERGGRKDRLNPGPWCCLDLQLRPKTWVISLVRSAFSQRRPSGDQPTKSCDWDEDIESCQFQHSRQHRRGEERTDQDWPAITINHSIPELTGLTNFSKYLIKMQIVDWLQNSLSLQLSIFFVTFRQIF